MTDVSTLRSKLECQLGLLGQEGLQVSSLDMKETSIKSGSGGGGGLKRVLETQSFASGDRHGVPSKDSDPCEATDFDLR